MARIAWYSNACHIPSGYGAQSAQVVHRMVKDGHEAAIAANHGAPVLLNCAHGHPILPEGLLRYSIDSAPDAMQDWIGDGPGYGVVLFDLWPLVGIEGFKRLNLACWTPVDHAPAPTLVAKFIQDGEHVAIAMSRFGEEQLRNAGIPEERLTYIPHAIDRNTFKDLGKGQKTAMGIPEDAYLVVTVAANRGRIPVRKGFGEMADAMAAFMKDRPDVYWMIHTEPNGHSEGVNIPRLINAVGIDPQRVRYPHPRHFRNGIPDTALAAMYSSASAHLLTSMGEGFGIPVVEGQACGTPAIVSDFSAQPELLGPHGKRVKVQRVWDEYQASFFGIPNVEGIKAALQELYEETKGGGVDRAAVAKSMERYDAETVYQEGWRPLTERMLSRGKTRSPGTREDTPAPVNRAARRAAARGGR
jgi:glycosyltransferase involved in cell wall biosynthesis